MIRYTFSCAEGHEFEAWFRNSAACDEQLEAGLVSCGICGGTDVKKALMAPSIPAKSNAKPEVQATAAPAPVEDGSTPQRLPVMTGGMGEEAQKLVHAMRKFRETVTKHADYVGPRFAEEARKIHFGESGDRGIYGEATPEEAKALSEDGVDIVPLPMLPEDQN
ncbi:MAG: DUF1178 family protein [Pseudomonadota bacterium]